MPITDAFADAAADIMGVDDFRDSAELTPLAGGAAISCSVYFVQRIEAQPGGYEAQVWANGREIEALYSVVGNLYPGDIFTIPTGINAGSWTVASVTENDGYFIKAVVK